jgi:hypothetical protein
MPQGNTALRTNLSSTAVPNRTVATGGQGQIVTVTISFTGGVAYKPLDIIDALEAKYGAGKVQSMRDSQPPYGTLDVQIIP